MAGVVEGFRWALLGKAAPPGTVLIVSVAATAILLVGGLFYFARIEKTFPDII
jgi:lipopolysaccharide transport system permease protein